MKRYTSNLLWLTLALSVVGSGWPQVRAAEPADAQERAAIAKTAEAFVESFHKGDAKAVAAFWTTDGDFVDLDGHVMKGRQAIENDFVEMFAENKGAKLRIDIANLKFPTPDTAVEDGTTTVMTADGSKPSRARYTNFLVKKDGKWLLSSVREALFTPPSNETFLRGLDWAIGEWVSDAGGDEVGHVTFEWLPEENFIISTHASTLKDVLLGAGTQWIGWDPAEKRIRSWTFESDGGFGEGTWTRDGQQKWIIKTSSVLRSGSKVTATNIVTRVDADTITWQSKDQLLDGKPHPDTKEIKMKRVK